MGYWLNWFMTKLDPDVGTKINNHLTLKFLNQHIGNITFLINNWTF